MWRLSLLSLIILCSFVPGYAQENKPFAGVGIETNVMAGKILRHSKKLPSQMPDVVSCYELNFIYQTHGTKDWHQRRKYPIVGFGIAYTDYGIDSVYGKCISIYPNLQIPLISTGKFEWTLKAGFGLGYATRPYQRYPSMDTFNTAIGGHLNNYSYFATDLRYRVNEHLDIQAGGNFSHISNATFRTPNLGINLYGVHAGIRYFPVTSQPAIQKRNIPKLNNRWLIQARLGLSAVETAAADGPLYPVYLVSLYTSKRYASKNKAFAGIDYSYHSNIYSFLRNNEVYEGDEYRHSWKSSVFIGNEFLIGRVGIHLQLGYYIKKTYLDNLPIYEKIGGNFYIIQQEKGFIKESFLSILLKANSTEAELVEIGLGFGF